MAMPLDTIIRERFGIHRGTTHKGYIPNSLKAIRAAVSVSPPFVEFDISPIKGKLLTGHPPQRPVNEFHNALKIFDRKKETYPKIDVKIGLGKAVPEIIDQVLNSIQQRQIKFSLINIHGGIDRNDIIQAEVYLASKIVNNPKVKLNIDPARYRPSGKIINHEILDNVKKLGNAVFSISPEIHEENHQVMAGFAEECDIGKIVFWLKGWPDVPNPKVSETIIRKAILLEKDYPVSVYFDINPVHIVKS